MNQSSQPFCDTDGGLLLAQSWIIVKAQNAVPKTRTYPLPKATINTFCHIWNPRAPAFKQLGILNFPGWAWLAVQNNPHIVGFDKVHDQCVLQRDNLLLLASLRVWLRFCSWWVVHVGTPAPKSPTQSTAVISYGNYIKLYEIIASQTSLPSIYSQTSTFPTVKMLLSYVTRQIWTTHIIYISLLIPKHTNITTHHHQKKMKRLCRKKGRLLLL
jgi:hypothetical protein